MSSILYYSKYCKNCDKLLQMLSKSQTKADIHFLCIDKRVQKGSDTHLILENGQEILLPPTVNRVPALLLLNKGHQVLFGEDIYTHIKPQEVVLNNQATLGQGEPQAFSLGQGSFGVLSDNYSFWDQGADDLSTKGDGGLRQMHNYVTLEDQDNITTPPENYKADTIGEVNLEQIQQERQQMMNNN